MLHSSDTAPYAFERLWSQTLSKRNFYVQARETKCNLLGEVTNMLQIIDGTPSSCSLWQGFW